MKISPNILPFKTSQQVAEEAKKKIYEERKGEQFGLYTRWPGLNKAMRKYIRFGNVYLLAGLSGHGKSLLLTILQNDFLDLEDIKGKDGNIIHNAINKNSKFKPLLLHFCYEMAAVDEAIRSVSNSIKKSYNYILSSDYNKELDMYNTISEDELIYINENLDQFGKRPMFFFETAGNLKQLYDTVAFFYHKYPSHKLIVSIDHTLLSNKLDEENDIELMANTGIVSIALRKNFGAMIILLGQLNSNIEDVQRLTKKELHYPQKSDIYAQARVYHAADTVMTVHRPELLKISKYGKSQKPTKDLLHLQILKARHGVVGNIWLRFNQVSGEIIPYEDLPDKNTMKFS